MSIILAVFCNILWGSAFPFVKIGYEQFAISSTADKMVFAGVRFCMAGLLLLIVYSIQKKHVPKVPREDMPLFCAIALVQTTVEYLFFYVGLSNTAASNGSIVNSCSVFWGVILAHFVYKQDKLTWNKAVGCVIGFLGVLAVTLGEGARHFAWNGEGFIALSSLAFAVGGMLSKRAGRKHEAVLVTGYNLFLGGAVLLGVGLCLGGGLPQVTRVGLLVLMYLSLLSAAAFGIWTWLLKNYPVGQISFYNFVIPVSGTILSAVFLGEDILRWQYGVALLLVTVGIYFINAHGGIRRGQRL